MDASLEELAMRGGAWLSLGSWAACEWLRGRPTLSHDRQARVFFVLGLAALIGHSVLAMHVRYAWSGEAALLDAARRIETVTVFSPSTSAS